MRRTAAAALVLALASQAAADPAPSPPTAPASTEFFHVLVPWTLTTESGTTRKMPPAHIYTDPAWGRLDIEMKRLQNQETRLTAENKALKTDLEKWQPGWVTLISVAASAIALGWYAHDKL